MAKRKSFEEKNNTIHPSRKIIIDTVFGRQDTNKRTFGYDTGAKTLRKVGETWTDSDGVKWEQKDGYKSTVTEFHETRQYLDKLSTCSDDECQTIKYNTVDTKLISKTGMCLECLTKFEHGLRVDGTFPFYQDYRVTLNKLSYIKDVRQKYDDAYGAVKQSYENILEDGTVEKWDWDIDIEKVKADIKKDMKSAEEAIELLVERKRVLEDKLLELNHPELIRK